MRDTIELTREAGLIKTVDCCGVPDKFCGQDEWRGNLKVFAAIVRADERNSWPAEMEAMERQVNILTDALAAEREACAKVCEDMAKGYEERNARPEETRDINPEVARIASMTCAFVEDAIRARGNT